MWHYTINTADTYNFFLKSFDDQLLSVVQPIAQAVHSNSVIEKSLPPPFIPYSVLVIVNPGFAHFNVYWAKELVSVNTVCWSEAKQTLVWEIVQDQFLELTQEYSSLSRYSLKYPKRFPWLTTLALPNPKALAPWLIDFEQCLASALAEVDRLSLSAI